MCVVIKYFGGKSISSSSDGCVALSSYCNLGICDEDVRLVVVVVVVNIDVKKK